MEGANSRRVPFLNIRMECEKQWMPRMEHNRYYSGLIVTPVLQQNEFFVFPGNNYYNRMPPPLVPVAPPPRQQQFPPRIPFPQQQPHTSWIPPHFNPSPTQQQGQNSYEIYPKNHIMPPTVPRLPHPGKPLSPTQSPAIPSQQQSPPQQLQQQPRPNEQQKQEQQFQIPAAHTEITPSSQELQRHDRFVQRTNYIPPSPTQQRDEEQDHEAFEMLPKNAIIPPPLTTLPHPGKPVSPSPELHQQQQSLPQQQQRHHCKKLSLEQLQRQQERRERRRKRKLRHLQKKELQLQIAAAAVAAAAAITQEEEQKGATTTTTPPKTRYSKRHIFHGTTKYQNLFSMTNG